MGEHYLPPGSALSPNIGLPCNLWVTLNKLRIGVAHFGSTYVSGGWKKDRLVHMRGGKSNSTPHYLSLRGPPTTKLPWWLGVSRSRGCLLVGPTCRDRSRVAARTKEKVAITSLYPTIKTGGRQKQKTSTVRGYWNVTIPVTEPRYLREKTFTIVYKANGQVEAIVELFFPTAVAVDLGAVRGPPVDRDWQIGYHCVTASAANLETRALQTFLSEGHISYYTTVQGPDILRNVIVSGIWYCFRDMILFPGYDTFYQTNKIFVQYIIFLLTKWLREPDEMASREGLGPRAEVWRPLL